MDEYGLDSGFRLAGDYYAEDDVVTRGVTVFADSQFGSSSPFDPFGPNLKDKNQDYSSLEDPFAAADPFSAAPPPPPPAPLSRHGSDTLFGVSLPTPTPLIAVDESQFAEPRQVPFGGCAFTSVPLGSVSHVDAMRAIVGFFQSQEMVCSITKHSFQKCSVKADVFMEEAHCGATCSVKARLFQDSNQLVAEFQRRSGDAVAFSSVFKRAQEYLRKYLAGEEVLGNSEIHAVPAGELLQEEDNLQPLVDTVCGAHSQEMQAEALASLLILTHTAATAAAVFKVCQGELRERLGELANSPVWSIAQPASRLASWQG